MSFRELESRINTNFNTIRTQVKELEFFELVKVIKHNRNDANGRPFKSVRLVNINNKY